MHLFGSLLKRYPKKTQYLPVSKAIRVDNGPEFTSAKFPIWRKRKNIEIQYIQPCKPVRNSLIERFNRNYRQEVLIAYLFNSLSQVRDLSEEWMEHYNGKSPHETPGNLTPGAFLKKAWKKKRRK